MKRIVEVNGRRQPIEWQAGADGQVEFRFNGAETPESVSVALVEQGIYSVLTRGASYEVKIVPAHDGWAVDVDGKHYVLRLVDPREDIVRSGAAAQSGPLRLTAPMPGKVVRVLVAAGDTVETGQGLVVVEAMKMQNEVKAPRPGRIVSVAAKPAATVNPGEVLVILE